MRVTPQEQAPGVQASASAAVVPLAVPLLAGPGAISDVIIANGLKQLFPAIA
jgi:small neutral amino acid transporter SnatA (MarC family)